MGLEKIRLAAQFGIAGILRLAERMPRVIAAASRRKLDRLPLPYPPLEFGSIFPTLDNIFSVNNNRRMAGQPDLRRFRAFHIHGKEHGVQRRHIDELILAIGSLPREVQSALAEWVV